MPEQEWDARTAGTALLADVTAAIAKARTAAETGGRQALDVELARAVLRSPALENANRVLLEAMHQEYEPKIAARLAAGAVDLIQAAEPAIRAQVAEEIALAIEQSQGECDLVPPFRCLQAQADVATARRIGGGR